MDAKEGMRVQVFSSDQSEDWGLGTIEKVEPLIIDETQEKVMDDYPSVIRLDSGKVTQGLKCWWHEV